MASGQAGLESFLEDITPFFYRRRLTYVDVGAYQGGVFEKVLASELKVREAHLIEPNSKSLQEAKRRFGGVFKGDSLHFYQLAMGEKSGRVRMAAAKTMTRVLTGGYEQLEAGDADTQVFEAECVTLDELAGRFTERRISLLKIDVEGFEDKVLAGAARLLDDQRVDVVYIEAGMNPEGTQQCYYRTIEDILARHGYRLFRIYEQHFEWMEDSPLLRRANLAFMSRRFADANPYRLTMELYQARKDLASLRAEIEATESRVQAAVQERDAQRLAAETAERGLRAEIEATESRVQAAVQERDAQRLAAETAERGLRAEIEATESRVQAALQERDAQRLAAETAERGRATLQVRSEAAERERMSLAAQLMAAGIELAQLKKQIEIAELRPRIEEFEGERLRAHESMSAALQAIDEMNVRMQAETAALRNALAGIQRSRAYRMGRAVADHRHSPMNWLSMIPALWHARLLAVKPPVARGGPDDPRAHVMSLLGPRSKLTTPVAKTAQFIVLPRSTTPYDIWVTAFFSETRETMRVLLTLRGAPGVAAPVVDATDAGGARHQLAEGQPLKLPVLVGRAMRLLQVPAVGHELVLELRGLSVRRQAVRLELQASHIAVGQQLLASPTQPSSIPQHLPGAVSQQRASPTQPSSMPRHLGDGLPSNDSTTASESEQLDWKLWGGYAPYALEALEQRKLDSTVPPREREAASWYIARWYFVEQELDRVLDEIAFMKGLSKKPLRRVALLEVQCLLLLGRPEEALTCLEQAQMSWPADKFDLVLLRATVLRALALRRGQTLAEAEALQLEALNVAYHQSGLAPLAKRDPSLPLTISNLASTATPEPDAQDRKVSVIVPVFNAEESIEWVVDGVLKQTWRNLEVVVVDDLSTDRTCAAVEAIAQRDSRVRLVRKPTNDGAYPTRNAGARVATGHYITVHDSDDWSHPQKIEMEVRALEASPQSRAVITHWVRVNNDLEIVGPWIPRGNLFDVNFSSLMFERSLLDKIGFWDEVRVSGDAEFFYRLRAMFGPDSVHKLPSRYLLSLSLVREDSLTRAKATHLRSLFYGLRWNYRDAYLWRLRQLGGEDPRPIEQTSGRRLVSAPLGILPKRPDCSDFGVVVVCDFAEPGDAAQQAIGALAAARKAGLRIGVFHWRKYERPARALLQPDFYETVMRDGVEILSPGDQARADILLVFDAAILNYRIEPAPQITARWIGVVVEATDVAGRDRSAVCDRALARAHLQGMFGADPEFVASDYAEHGEFDGLLRRLTALSEPAVQQLAA